MGTTIILLLSGAFLLGLVAGALYVDRTLKSNIAKGVIYGNKRFLRFKKGYQTHYIEMSRRSHLSVYTTEDEILDWKNI